MQQLTQYEAYIPDNLANAKQEKDRLNEPRRTIEERRKEVRRSCLEPYTAVGPKFKELVALVDRPLTRINTFIEENTPALPEEDAVTGYQILKLIGTPEQLATLMEQAKKLGMAVEVLEDGMPAVKVIDGQIVARFSELANPGREIIPSIARLTHITNEMVQDKPPIDEVIRQFKDFVDDHILVGHNIKSCDIPHISKSAKRAGVAFDNPYFDTYRYTKQLKDTMGWKNVKQEIPVPTIRHLPVRRPPRLVRCRGKCGSVFQTEK